MDYVKVADAKRSETNPRPASDFKGVEFEGLVASIKEKGVLVPVLVRALTGKNKVGKWEVIAGNRRLVAAREAGLDKVPALIVEMTDTEAREAQIIENLQRVDIAPLDEGLAYRKLIEGEQGYTVDDVAVKVGKSVSYVRDRLMLTNLIAPIKKMLKEGVIKPSHGALVARLTAKNQKQLVEWLEPDWDGQVISLSTLREQIQESILDDVVANPPWKNDEAMQDALGGCDECQGQGGDLFGKKASEACTNPKCYAQRLGAYIAIKRTKEPELVPLSGNYSSPDKDLLTRNGYKEINSKKDACKTEERGIIIDGSGMGQIIRFCRNGECKKHWADTRPSGSQYKPTKAEKEARKKQREKEKKQKERDDKKILTAVGKVTWPLTAKHLDILLDMTFGRLGYSYLQPVAKRHGIKADVIKHKHGYNERDLVGPLSAWIDSGKTKKARQQRAMQLIFEIMLESNGGVDSDALKKF